MPIVYKIDTDKKIIRTQCIDSVNVADILNHFDTLINDPACPESPDVVLDLTKQKTTPEGFQLRRVSEKIRSIRDKIKFQYLAIVVNSLVIYGMLRMFSVFVEDLFREVQIFRNAERAEEWILMKNKLKHTSGV